MVEETFQTSVVGSWPRPDWLLDELRKKNDGEITYEEFSAKADAAVLAAAKYQEEAGLDYITDGEQRRDSFYSFVVDKLDGIKLMSMADLMDYIKDKLRYEQMLRARDVPAFAIRTPVVYDKVARKRSLALDELEFLRKNTKKKIKVSLPGPYMLTRASWIEPISKNGYSSREELGRDYAKILREEIIQLRDAGASFVQLDEPSLTEIVYGEASMQTFMCAVITSKVEPKEELAFATELINGVVGGISGVKTGVHICRGNWSTKEEILLRGDYGPLVKYLQQMKVNQYVLEFATERAGKLSVLDGLSSGGKELGLGVVNPRTSVVESSSEIASKVREAMKYFDPSCIFLNPDCGFATFAETPLNSAETAYRKLASMSAASAELRGACIERPFDLIRN
ncbi:MAG: cobalamin-independent methionine synthase II family protein [Nitrososphaerota archaeon]|nr:cobalamin-independent methionine synthase II family protein [Nitrososphaerota archaeon]MDG6922329.1 cobalamin-independent methionine synthase II family protein [Nitrososphaerota archaeon]